MCKAPENWWGGGVEIIFSGRCQFYFYSLIFFWQHCEACGILVPRAGIKLTPLQWKHGASTTECRGHSQKCIASRKLRVVECSWHG